MSNHDIIVIGTSAGGLETLGILLASLPADLPAAVFIVQHLSGKTRSMLPSLLQKKTVLPVLEPSDGLPFANGRIYVAPPDHHMLLWERTVRIIRGPPENRHRPAIDVLFRSAAWHHGPRVIGVVLTGCLDDGSAGLAAIKRCGGVAVVEDPATARYASMPANALAAVDADAVAPVEKMAGLLVELVGQPAADSRLFPVPESIKIESRFAMMERGDMSQLGGSSELTCPSCHGVIWEMADEAVCRFRCHTGHAFSLSALAEEQAQGVEEALYAAVRALQESSSIARRLAARGLPDQQQHEGKAREFEAAAGVLRALLVSAAEKA